MKIIYNSTIVSLILSQSMALSSSDEFSQTPLKPFIPNLKEYSQQQRTSRKKPAFDYSHNYYSHHNTRDETSRSNMHQGRYDMSNHLSFGGR